MMTASHTIYSYHAHSTIHEISLKRPTRMAFDEFIDIMNEIYRPLTPQDTVRILIDYRQSGLPPIQYALQRGLGWAKTLKVHPTARIAVVTKRDFLLSMLDQTVRMNVFHFSHLKTRFFESPTAYEEATVWLTQS